MTKEEAKVKLKQYFFEDFQRWNQFELAEYLVDELFEKGALTLDSSIKHILECAEEEYEEEIYPPEIIEAAKVYAAE